MNSIKNADLMLFARLNEMINKLNNRMETPEWKDEEVTADKIEAVQIYWEMFAEIIRTGISMENFLPEKLKNCNLTEKYNPDMEPHRIFMHEALRFAEKIKTMTLEEFKEEEYKDVKVESGDAKIVLEAMTSYILKVRLDYLPESILEKLSVLENKYIKEEIRDDEKDEKVSEILEKAFRDGDISYSDDDLEFKDIVGDTKYDSMDSYYPETDQDEEEDDEDKERG